MTTKILTKNLAVSSASTILLLAMGGAYPGDVKTITVVHDQAVAERTNMQRPANESSTLGVAYDQGVAERTNMTRQPGDVAPPTVVQDKAVLERTNVGDVARNPKSKEPVQPIQTGSTK